MSRSLPSPVLQRPESGHRQVAGVPGTSFQSLIISSRCFGGTCVELRLNHALKRDEPIRGREANPGHSLLAREMQRSFSERRRGVFSLSALDKVLMKPGEEEVSICPQVRQSSVT